MKPLFCNNLLGSTFVSQNEISARYTEFTDGEFLVILLTLTVTSEEGTQKDLCSIDNVALCKWSKISYMLILVNISNFGFSNRYFAVWASIVHFHNGCLYRLIGLFKPCSVVEYC